MDQFTEGDDLSTMMDSVEIPTSELNCVNSVANSVQDTKNDPPEFDKSLYGTALDPTLLTVTSLEDYSDVSSCSEADFGRILNILEKKP